MNMDRERMNFKCYSKLKRRFGLTVLQLREKRALVEDIPYLMEAILLMEAQYVDDMEEQEMSIRDF